MKTQWELEFKSQRVRGERDLPIYCDNAYKANMTYNNSLLFYLFYSLIRLHTHITGVEPIIKGVN